MMPSLDEVLAAFPERRFLINIKSNDPDEGVALVKRLRQLPAERRAALIVYGGDAPTSVMRRELPEFLVMSRTTLKQCVDFAILRSAGPAMSQMPAVTASSWFR